jgi:hypothetical protein
LFLLMSSDALKYTRILHWNFLPDLSFQSFKMICINLEDVVWFNMIISVSSAYSPTGKIWWT